MRMLCPILLACALCTAGLAPPAWAQCPPKTTVNDTLYNADGSPAAGRVVIAWPTFQIGACQVIAGQATVTVASGDFSVQLYPNDAAVPAGTSYRATYYLKSGRITTEYWVAPTSASPVNLAAVRSSSVPVPTVMFGQAQVTNLVPDLARKIELPAPCVAGKFLQANGSSSPPQVSCVDGTGAPLSSSAQSGTVKTDVDEADPRVYTKASTDSMLAGKANASHPHAAADITSGVLDPTRLPAPSATTLGGVRSGACSGFDKVTGINTTGQITCGTDQTGGSGSQHQVNGTNLAASDPVNFQDTATVALTNPSAGNIQADVKDGSITAGKLFVASPTGGQLGGIGDANIPAGALSPDRTSGTAEVQTNKGAANGYAALNASQKVVQDPANTQTTAAASKIPIAGGGGTIDDAWLSAGVTKLGATIELDSSEVTNTLPASKGGTGANNTVTSGRYLRGDGTNFVPSAVAAAGAGACTNQFVRSANDNAAPTCATVTSSDVDSTVVKSSDVLTIHVALECYNPRVKSLAGNAFFDVEGLTTADYDQGVYKFTNNVDGRVSCTGRVPNELAATPNAAFIFDVMPHVACGASQNFRFNVRYRFFGATTVDTALTAETEQSIAGSTTAHSITRATFPSSSNLANAPSAGDNIYLEIQNNGASASDTCEQVKELLPRSVVLRVDVKVK